MPFLCQINTEELNIHTYKHSNKSSNPSQMRLKEGVENPRGGMYLLISVQISELPTESFRTPKPSPVHYKEETETERRVRGDSRMRNGELYRTSIITKGSDSPQIGAQERV